MSRKLLHSFLNQLQATPDKVTIIENSAEVTYKQLNEYSNVIARTLVENGVVSGKHVIFHLEQSSFYLASVIAAFKLGVTYIPLGPTLPQERKQLILEDSGASLILSRRNAALGNVENELFLDELDWENNAEIDDEYLNPHTEYAAALLYTSGSTGTPKGALISSLSIEERIGWSQRAYPLDPSKDTCIIKTNIGFIDSITEQWNPLIEGVTSVICSPQEASDVNQLASLIYQHRVTRLVAVPSLLQTFIGAISDSATLLGSLKVVVSSGEALTAPVAKNWLSVFPQSTLVNAYGCSETNDMIFYTVPKDIEEADSIPIGKPVENVVAVIVDEDNKILEAPDAQGELLIARNFPFLGYWQRPEQNAEKFVALPGIADKKFYRTGDLVTRDVDGNFVFLGRIDHQIKLRGFRIELGEIEQVALTHPNVGLCCAVLHNTPWGGDLVLYIEVVKSSEVTSDEMRSYLTQRIPAYMLPNAIITLDTLPTLYNGKIDRARLSQRQHQGEQSEITPAQTQTEQHLVLIFADILRLESVSRDANFFAVGGNSLAATQVVNRISEQFNLSIKAALLVNTPVLHELATQIDSLKQLECLKHEEDQTGSLDDMETIEF